MDRLDTIAQKILDRLVILRNVYYKAKKAGDDEIADACNGEIYQHKEELKELKDEDRKKQGGGRL